MPQDLESGRAREGRRPERPCSRCGGIHRSRRDRDYCDRCAPFINIKPPTLCEHPDCCNFAPTRRAYCCDEHTLSYALRNLMHGPRRSRSRGTWARECEECGEPFTATHNRQRYCSEPCARRVQNRIQHEKDKASGRFARRMAERERDLRRATPKWANRDAMNAIYASREEGEHVDHIVPVKGTHVRGLHVETNLRVLPGDENEEKSNHFKYGWEILRPDLLR